jgi:hypothetical protein
MNGNGFVDPSGELVEAVLRDKAVRLARDAFERLIEEGEEGGLGADEVFAICHRVIVEAEADGNGEVFPRMHAAVVKAIETRGDGAG